VKIPGITLSDKFKHLVLLVLVPYDHYGCRRCEKVNEFFKARLREIPMPAAPRTDVRKYKG